MYLLYGEDEGRINKVINNFIDKRPEYIVFNFEEMDSVSSFIMNLSSKTLFKSKSIIIFKNPSFIINKYNEEEISTILYYLNLYNENKDKVVFFKINSNKIDLKNPIVNWFKNEVNRMFNYPLMSMEEYYKYVADYVKLHNGKISFEDVLTFCSYVPNQTQVIDQELDKLLLRSKDIKINLDIDFNNYKSNNIYQINNYLENMDFKNLISESLKYLSNPEDLSKLWNNLSFFFTLPYKYYIYTRANWTVAQIQEKEKIHIYKLHKASEVLNKYGIEKIKNILKYLNKIEIESKIYSNVSKENLMLLFLMKITNESK
ncbi:DNA polymerase III subunit delta [Mycoplasma phocimorsus]|uniref:DNA polymerase III delta N-terminal domain-containing protein n=1 Tax=Mycoplasma phocimorsus TaxID=3045839 RepID=A0AAJ1UZP9_9MOLU|nr:hypothetical protein [Mycoplasma phocimorsus]MDJ1645958.1 hypothetical protein [Mycoplasma phocimorsus]MDJ1646244.1 hypothetical protein [Mycoplasma phocimorsus]MDJ1646846.1 hypothetical protein [Mycoplasma phocimorsus]MDJ1648486.1 hypothetical protein [Mycoplasma phocimorsus]